MVIVVVGEDPAEIVIVKVWVDIPAAFDAVIVYVVAANELAGVPLNKPVAGSNESPVGSAGEMS
jgi:hypothetical protein